MPTQFSDQELRCVHLLGAGGAGVSGLARLLVAQGVRLTGQDSAESRFTRALVELGARLTIGESRAENLPPDVDLVIRSAAVPLDDPQVVEAMRRGLPVAKYAEVMGRVLPPERTLAVAGTHGKTTTSWLLYHALRGVRKQAGASAPEPGALVGGWERELGTNAVPAGPSGWMAVEACEYDRSFLQLAPRGAIVTNVEGDHLDYYGDLASVEAAFCRFVDGIHPDGLLVLGPGAPDALYEAAPCDVWRIGRELAVDLHGERRGRFRFRLRGPGWATPEVELPLPGVFNVENAACALALAVGLVGREWGTDPEHAAREAARTLASYGGSERRFEPWGEAGGISVIHDYAHHPTEVRATVEATRRVFPSRPLHVLFQPHQHSRTSRFLREFVESLRGVDRVVVAPVYGARRHIDSQGAGSPDLAAGLLRAGVPAVAPDSLRSSTEELAAGLPEEACALILGAGDVDGIRDDLFQALALRRHTESRARV